MRKNIKQEANSSQQKAAELPNLYNFTNSGYFTLSRDGMIIDVNSRGALMLDKEKSDLISTRFDSFIKENTIQTYHHFLERVFNNIKGEICEVNLLLSNSRLLTVQIEGMLSEDGKQCIIMSNDITERRQTEFELLKCNEKYKEIFEHLQDVFYQTDLYGSILEISPSIKQHFGFNREDLIGQSVYRLYSDHADRKILLENLMKTGELRDYDLKILTKTGSIKYISINARLVCNSYGKPDHIDGIIRDITGRKIVEEELRESREKYHLLLENSGIGAAVYSLAGEIQYLNNKAIYILGGKAEDYIGKSLQELFGEQSAADYLKRLHEAANSETSIEYEDYVTLPSGRFCFLSNYTKIIGSDKKIIGVQVLSHDITERKYSEQEILKSEKRFKAIFDNAPIGMILIDDQGSTIISNPSLSKMLGYSKDEFLNIMIGKITHEEDTEKDLILFNELVNGHISDYRIEKRYIHKNGKLIWGDLFVTLLRDENGNTKEIIGMIKDISERKLAEEALRESEARLYTLFKTIPDLIWLKDTNGVYLGCNTMFERFFGADESEIIGKSDYDFVEKNLADFFRDHDINAMQSGKPTKNEEWITFANDGHEAFLETIKAPMYDSEGKLIGVLGIGRDITLRNQDEKNLKLLSKAIEQSPVTVVITDKFGQIEYVNPKFTDTTGYTLDEVKGKNPRFLQSGHQTKEFYSDLWKTILSGNNWYGNFQNKKKNGESFWESAAISSILNSKGDITAFIAVKEDITEKRKMIEHLINAKEEAEESAQKLSRANDILNEKNTFIQKILDNLPIGLSLNDFRDGKTTYMNKKFEDIYGWKSNEIPNTTSFFEKIYPDKEYRNQLIERVISDISTGDQEKMHWENIFVTRKDGTQRIINAVNIPLIEQNTMVSTVMDFTALYHTQTELVKAKEHAEESDRLKSAFLANMSHEIRTPMNGILGFAGLLKEPRLSGEEQQEYISIIEKSGARMLSIINDIISISKVESGQMEVVIKETNINEQIDYIFAFFKPEADQKGIKLIHSHPLPSKEAIIKTDREKIYAILTNLVKNALKFTQTGTIDFGYHLMSDVEPQLLEFFVKDTGAGIYPEQQEFIFERFRQGTETLNRIYEGAGLGLSISKAYVEMLGGKIRVKSEKGNGSTFYFTIPYNPNLATPKPATNIESIIQPENQIKKLKILIAEDDETSEVLIRMSIKSFVTESLRARTGIEAVDTFRNNPDIDLILMDIKMPEMDGLEATRQIRLFNQEVIIIAQTAFALAGDKGKALNAGCNEYITKPFSKSLLISMLKKYFRN